MDRALVIRADANTRMGTGHVMRCIALGQAWQDAGGAVSFVSCCNSEAVRNRIREEGFDLTELPEAYPASGEDLPATLHTACQKDASWVVVDGYHYDLAYQRSIRAAGFRLLCVDDYNHLPQYEADLLLNQNVGAGDLVYQVNAPCRKLLGMQYILLRREFRKADPRIARNGPEMPNLLITMGGADPDNASLAVLRVLDTEKHAGLNVRVLVGAANKHRDALSAWVDSSPLQVELLNPSADIPGLMQWSDFTISAAGSTCWELLAMQVPFASVILAENQAGIADGLNEKFGVSCAGWVDDGFDVRLKKILDEELSGASRESQRGRCSVNVRGADMVVMEMRKEWEG